MRGHKTVVSLSYRIINPSQEHGAGVHEVVCLANDFPVGTQGCIGTPELTEQIKRFPAGQFIAVTTVAGQEKVIGVAAAMRTDYPPSARPLNWREMIGTMGLVNHAPEGKWLYGVEKAVHPDYQGMGVGSALYKAQFALAKKLNLKGIYAGGMLKGFKNFKHEMSLREYAGKVMRGELFDPTVSVQMRKGFAPRTLIENYSWDHEAEHAGMLIVWENAARYERPTPKPAFRAALR